MIQKRKGGEKEKKERERRKTIREEKMGNEKLEKKRKWDKDRTNKGKKGRKPAERGVSVRKKKKESLERERDSILCLGSTEFGPSVFAEP